MAKEQALQTTIIRYLKAKGCVVAKMQAGMGVPKGMSDIFWCYKKTYGWLEVKASRSAKRQVGQPEFIEHMQRWGVPAYFVYPENWEEVKQFLCKIIKEEDAKKEM